MYLNIIDGNNFNRSSISADTGQTPPYKDLIVFNHTGQIVCIQFLIITKWLRGGQRGNLTFTEHKTSGRHEPTQVI